MNYLLIPRRTFTLFRFPTAKQFFHGNFYVMECSENWGSKDGEVNMLTKRKRKFIAFPPIRFSETTRWGGGGLLCQL